MWYIKSSFIMNSVHVSCSIVHVFAKWQEVLEKCWGTGELQAEFKDSLQSIQASKHPLQLLHVNEDSACLWQTLWADTC